MRKLTEYVHEHTERGACICGKCVDAGLNPKEHQPTGHTADLAFFKVKAVKNPDAKTLRELIKTHQGVDPFDGNEHSYIELGAWVGDQSTALLLMGLGSLLGLWELLTPRTVLGNIPEALVQQMAGRGYVSVKTPKESRT